MSNTLLTAFLATTAAAVAFTCYAALMSTFGHILALFN